MSLSPDSQCLCPLSSSVWTCLVRVLFIIASINFWIFPGTGFSCLPLLTQGAGQHPQDGIFSVRRPPDVVWLHSLRQVSLGIPILSSFRVVYQVCLHI